jgi:sigma-E factor negative regulatory protein RseA
MMNDRHNEMEALSALLDDEAGELDIHRILKHPPSSEALAALRRYQAVRAVLAGQHGVARIDVRERVAQALQAEPDRPLLQTTAQSGGDSRYTGARADQKPPRRTGLSAHWRLASGFAVAASVAAAVMFSGQFMQQGEDTTALPLAQQSQPLLPQATLQPEMAVAGVASTKAEQVADEEYSRRLNAYLMRHAEHAAMNNGQGVMPFARLAGYENPPSPKR